MTDNWIDTANMFCALNKNGSQGGQRVLPFTAASRKPRARPYLPAFTRSLGASPSTAQRSARVG